MGFRCKDSNGRWRNVYIFISQDNKQIKEKYFWDHIYESIFYFTFHVSPSLIQFTSKNVMRIFKKQNNTIVSNYYNYFSFKILIKMLKYRDLWIYHFRIKDNTEKWKQKKFWLDKY